MTIEETIRLMEAERDCIARQVESGGCDRDCGKCDLVQDSDKLFEAYVMVLDILNRQESAEWIFSYSPEETNTFYKLHWNCSYCNRMMGILNGTPTFCPKCGRRMSVPDEDREKSKEYWKKFTEGKI